MAAAYRLFKARKNLEVTLIDKKWSSDFLPTLPDCIGRGINPESLSYKIESAAKRFGFRFIYEEVISVGLEKKQAYTASGAIDYDYLIIASGSETNFYGNENIKKYAYKLDEVEDARKIISALKQSAFENFIIGGGGYTGIEVVTNLRRYLNKIKSKKKIIIVERTPSILGPLPAWMKDYVLTNLKSLNVEVLVNSSLEKIEDEKVYVSGGRIYEKSLVVWAAGVKTSGFIQSLNSEKNPQGRIKVDEYLRLNESCFVIGDAAFFSYKSSFLRMAVQFAIAQGDCAAANVINQIKKRKLKKFKPLDFGYIIPMANNKSCGKILGLNLKGALPTIFHFLMCVYRSYSLKNKSGLILGLLKGGA